MDLLILGKLRLERSVNLQKLLPIHSLAASLIPFCQSVKGICLGNIGFFIGIVLNKIIIFQNYLGLNGIFQIKGLVKIALRLPFLDN